jgi:RNA polymerase sigma-70 factor (ECF subfamily)
LGGRTGPQARFNYPVGVAIDRSEIFMWPTWETTELPKALDPRAGAAVQQASSRGRNPDSGTIRHFRWVTLVIESSMDLRQWTPIQTNIVTAGSLTTRYLIDREVRASFFRARAHCFALNSSMTAPTNRSVFATTHWSGVKRASGEAEAQAASALEQLCRTYWYPLYAYVRRQGRGPEEAQDLTQAFFAQLLARESLQNVRREKGRFRSFLLASMNHFLADQWDRSSAMAVRMSTFLSDAQEAEERYRIEPVDRLDPQQLCGGLGDDVLDNALAKLEEECSATEPERWTRLKPFLIGEESGEPMRRPARNLEFLKLPLRWL